MRRVRTVTAASLSVACVALAACSSSSNGTSDQRSGGSEKYSITLAYSSPVPDPVGAMVQAGIQHGYFAQNKVGVSIQYVASATLASSSLQSGQADVAIGGPEQIPAANLQGGKQVAIYQYAYAPIFHLGFLDGNVDSVGGLKGKRIGVLSTSSGAIVFLQADLAAVGLGLQDVHLVPIGVGPQAIQAVKSGQVDALFYYTTGYVQMKSAGIKVTVQPSPLDGKYPGLVLYTKQSTVDTQKPALTAFLTGFNEALKWCLTDATACMKAYETYSKLPASGLEPDLAGWHEIAQYMTLPAAANGEYGYTDPSYWAELVKLQVDSHVISSAPPTSGMYSTDLLDAVNRGH